MKALSGNPHEGARQAYFALTPGANDMDWENWLNRTLARSRSEADKLAALAELCKVAVKCELSRETALLIAFATGFYEGKYQTFFAEEPLLESLVDGRPPRTPGVLAAS